MMSTCNGLFYVSPWLGHGMPRYLIKHYFQVCPWGWFWKRRAWTGGLHKADGPLQCGWASPRPLRTRNWTERLRKLGSLSCWLSWDINLLLLLRTLKLLNHTIRFLESPAFRQQMWDFSTSIIGVSQFLITNLFLYIYIYRERERERENLLRSFSNQSVTTLQWAASASSGSSLGIPILRSRLAILTRPLSESQAH